MAAKTKEEIDAFKALARRMFFSKDTVEWFCTESTAGQMKIVLDMLELEQRIRWDRKRQKLFRKAAFPALKTFDGYDFSQVMFPEGYSKDDLLTLDFIDQAQDFVFHGQTGRGKTHLAIAIGVDAVRRGKLVRFFTTASLVMALLRANEEGELDRMLAEIDKADLIILDEFGYMPIDIEGGRLLFQVISNAYERRSVILTTNIESSRWGTFLGDDKLASAAIDRIVHHGRLVEFEGESKRMGASLMLGRSQ